MSRENARSVRFVDSWASVDFDLLRAAAALLVLLEHSRNLFFIDFPQLAKHTGGLWLLYGLSGSGHQAVVLFFVLSGYFIGGTVLRSFESADWSWGGYLLRRLVRLWIVLVPTLLLCMLWDHLGIHLGRAPALYAGKVPDHMLGDVRMLLAPHIFFANLFFLQGVFTLPFGSDGSLWSLAFEFWYYILFPLGVAALWRKVAVRERVLWAALFIAVAWLVRKDILAGFPIWLTGAALYKLPRPSFSGWAGRVARGTATIVYFAIFFLLGRSHGLTTVQSDSLLAVATGVYLWILLSHREAYNRRRLTVKTGREMARFSYTLYAVHTPLLVLLASLTVGDSRWVPEGRYLIYGAALMLVALGFSYVLAWLTEFRTDVLRMRLERVLGMSAKRPALPSNPLQDATGAG